MKSSCLNHHTFEETCNACRLADLTGTHAQEIEVQGFKTDEDGFWLLVSPDTIRIYKGMRMREVRAL